MSKNHRENRRPAYADWIVRDVTDRPATITQAVFTRDEHGGYTFTDKGGITADFPPGTVLHVMRREPEPVPAPEPLASKGDESAAGKAAAAAIEKRRNAGGLTLRVK